MLKSIEKATAIRAGMSRDNVNNLKPTAIKRLANDHEIKIFTKKEGNSPRRAEEEEPHQVREETP